MTYQKFWPFYLHEHRNTLNRRLHFIGTAGSLLFLILSLLTQDGHFLWAMPLFGYGFTWVGHFFVEKNKPATFRNPFLSLVGDFHMFFLMLAGRLNRELEKHKIKSLHWT